MSCSCIKNGDDQILVRDPDCEQHHGHTLDEYLSMCAENSCRSCGMNLPDTILHYPHDGGWTVCGLPGRHWLYRRCVRCEHDWALWKLGVPREEP